MHKIHSILKGFKTFDFNGCGSGFEKQLQDRDVYRDDKVICFGDGDNQIYIQVLYRNVFSFGDGLSEDWGSGDSWLFEKNKSLTFNEE